MARGRQLSVLLALILLQCSAQTTSRITISPPLILAGESFRISLSDLSSAERNLSAINVTLTSSKMNEAARVLHLLPVISRGVLEFVTTVETVRSAAASRADLEAVHVVPGTRLHVSYRYISTASSDAAGGGVSAHSMSISSMLQVALEPSLTLPDLITTPEMTVEVYDPFVGTGESTGQNEGVNLSVTVSVGSPRAPHMQGNETVMLTEDSMGSRIFTGRLSVFRSQCVVLSCLPKGGAACLLCAYDLP